MGVHVAAVAGILLVSCSRSDLLGEPMIGVQPACTGIVWPVKQGGNGHCYRVVAAPGVVSWDDANAAAGAAGGHLATISSAAENAFVFYVSRMVTDVWAQDSVGGSQGPWLGGRKMGSTWVWVTGEQWLYSDWAAGEPTGTYNGVIEDRLQMRGEDRTRQPRETWNDQPNDGFEGLPRSYVIEFEP
jgi:hypothetical protein